MKAFRNWTLNRKFALFLVLLVIGFGAIGLTYNAVLNAEQASNTRSNNLTQFGDVVDQLRIDVLAAGNYARDFRLSNQLEDLELFDTTVKRAIDETRQLDSVLNDEAGAALLARLREVLKSYQSSFYSAAENQVAVGLDDLSGLRGEVTDAAQTLEASIQQAKDPALEATYLTMRRYENEMLNNFDRKYIEAITAARQKLADQIKASALSKATRAELTEQAGDYVDSVLGLAKALGRLNDSLDPVLTTIEQLDPIVSTLQEVKDERIANGAVIASAERDRITLLFFATLVVIAVVATLLLFLVSRSITGPLGRLRAMVSKVSGGDFEARARLGTRDELGALGDAFDTLLDERLEQFSRAERENEELNDSIISLLQGVSQLSRKDLTVHVPVTEDVTGTVADALNLLTSETARVLQKVSQVSGHVAQASDNVKVQGDTVITVAGEEQKELEQTVTELQSAGSAITRIAELARTTNVAADSASRTTAAALETVNSTVDGINGIRDSIHETEKRIKRLGDRSQEINGVVSLINVIAERTHILALNASMHAASAGEAGRGFAVVADEVQRLAENAREATDKISTLVNNIQVETSDTMNTMNAAISQVVEGTRLAQEAGKRMQETQQSTGELVQSVQRIAADSENQAVIGSVLLERAQRIYSSTQQTSQQLVAQSRHTDELMTYSSELLSAVSVFKLPEAEESEAEDDSKTSDTPKPNLVAAAA